MNTKFKLNKHPHNVVEFVGIVETVSDVDADRPDFNYCPQFNVCAQIIDDVTHKTYVIDLLEFMNTYSPATTGADNALSVFTKLMDKEDETYRENICTLHSGSTNADSGSNQEILEDSKQVD